MDVIYLNGGSGVRAELGYPKQFARIAGKPILIYGLETLNQVEGIDNIIIPSSDKEKTISILQQYNIEKYIVIDNGKTRQLSVNEALRLVTTKHVLIMEAVRPFCSIDLIKKVMSIDYDFVTPRDKMKATVICDWGKTVDRDKCGMVQMPQKYKTSLLKTSHINARAKQFYDYSDDVELVVCNSLSKPQVIEGEEFNIKITTPLDLRIAEGIYEYYNNRE